MSDETPSSIRSEEHTSELQSPCNLVCRLLLEKKNLSSAAFVLGRVPHKGSPDPLASGPHSLSARQPDRTASTPPHRSPLQLCVSCAACLEKEFVPGRCLYSTLVRGITLVTLSEKHDE